MKLPAASTPSVIVNFPFVCLRNFEGEQLYTLLFLLSTLLRVSLYNKNFDKGAVNLPAAYLLLRFVRKDQLYTLLLFLSAFLCDLLTLKTKGQ